MLKRRDAEDYLRSGKMRRGSTKINWGQQKGAKVWSTRSGPIQIIRCYDLKGQAEIVEFELIKINEDPK